MRETNRNINKNNKNNLTSFLNYIKLHFKDLKYIALILITAGIYFVLNRKLWYEPYNFKIYLDDLIPVIPVTVIIYHLWYPSLLVTLIYYVGKDKTLYYKTLISLFIGDIICLISYIFLQNEVVRSPLHGKDIFTKLLNFTRMSDNPYNGLPSMHVMACTVLILSYLKLDTKTLYKILLISLQVAVTISTLTTKQHYILDCVAAFTVGILSYYIVDIILKRKKIK